MKNLLKATCVMCCLLVGSLPVFAQRMDVSDDVNVKIEQAQENAYLASSNFSYEFGQSLVYFGGGVAVFGASAFIAQAIIQGNADLAKELTKKHIENAKNHMMGCVNING